MKDEAKVELFRLPPMRGVRFLLKEYILMRLLIITGILLIFSGPRVLNAQEVVLKYSLDADGDLRSVAFSPDGKLLATISGTKTDVWFWDSTTGKQVSKLSSGRDPANYVGESNFGLIMPRPGFMGLRFSPDARVLAVLAHVTNDLRLWDMKEARLYATLSGVKNITSFEFSPDGRLLALAMGIQGLKLIDVHTGQVLAGKWDFKHVRSVTGADFCKDGTTLIVGVALREDSNSGFYFVDIASGKIKSSILAPASHNLVGQISHDRGRIVTFESNNNDLKIWDTNTGQLKNTINTGNAKILDASISYDGRTVAAITKDGIVRLWNSETSELKGELEKQKDKSIYVIFCSDHVLVGSAKGLRFWDVTGKVLRQVLLEAPMDFSPDGQLVAAKKGAGAQVWQLPR